jgi:hypothetical protein
MRRGWSNVWEYEEGRSMRRRGWSNVEDYEEGVE